MPVWLSATGFSHGKQNTGTWELRIGDPNGTKVGIISKVPIMLSYSNLSRCDNGYKMMPITHHNPIYYSWYRAHLEPTESRFRKVKYPYHIPVGQLNYSHHILNIIFLNMDFMVFLKNSGWKMPQMKKKHHSKRSGRDVFVAQAIVCPGIPLGMALLLYYQKITWCPTNTGPPMFFFSPLLSALKNKTCC